jgi:hypothetical protein
MQFDPDGAERVKAAVPDSDIYMLEGLLTALPQNRPGIRLNAAPSLRPFLETTGSIGAAAARYLGAIARPVRAILFDKSPANNWALGWHQDRTIAVARRNEAAGFAHWGIKDGVPHVEPPFALLERMVTLRVHLDPIDDGNAPLLVAPGSHRFGRVTEAELMKVVEKCGSRPCLADRGDIWAYATPILHASEAAMVPTCRRVLQVDYSADDLPCGLAWAGI